MTEAKTDLEQGQYEDIMKAERHNEALIGIVAQGVIDARREPSYFNGTEVEIEHHVSPEASLIIRNYRDERGGKHKKVDGKTRIYLVVTTKDDAEAGQWLHAAGCTLYEAVPVMTENAATHFGTAGDLYLKLDHNRTRYDRDYGYDAETGVASETGTHIITFKLK